ncbi:MAG: aminotransferase class IV [Bradymonadia bacterium]
MNIPPAVDSSFWVNGILDGNFDPRDPGLLSGLSIFETMRTYGTHIFRLEDHYERLLNSALAVGITPPSFGHFKNELRTKAAPNVSLRYLITGGGQEVIYREPLDPKQVGRPIHLGAITIHQSSSLPGDVKHGSRAEWVLSARQQGVDEVLLCSENGEILEANRSAFIAVSQGVITLPPTDKKRLKSVTLGAVLDALSTLQLKVEVKPMFLHETFDEAYVVSTLKGISPVVSIQGRPVHSPGPVGRQLQHAFGTLVKLEAD